MVERLRSLFAFDTRSLAAFRIALGLLLLIDLGVRSTDLLSHYTDVGVLPRPARITLYEFRDESAARFWWSLHMINGTGWFQLALFGIAAWYAFRLTIGYRTRWSVVVSWVLLVSLHGRLPGVNQGGDILLRMLLFWSMFIPLGAVWSVDRWRLSPPPLSPPPRTCGSLGTFAIALQVLLMYWCTAYAKIEPTWTQELSAVYYTLEFDMYVRPLGVALRQHPALCRALTLLTVLLEWIGPALVLVPWRTWFFRTVAVALFCSFHLGLALCMELGLFSYVSMAAWLLFLPSEFWDAIASYARRWGNAGSRLARLAQIWNIWPLSKLARPAEPIFQLSAAGNTFVALVLGLVLFINVASLRRLDDPQRAIDGPGWLHTAVALLRVEQQWLMFAPRPTRADGWCVMRGVLVDGSVVNLWKPGEPLPIEKPNPVREQFPNHRWRKYIVHLCWDSDGEQLSCFSDWLRYRWNLFQSGGSPDRQVRTVEIIFHLEETQPPGEPPTPAVPYLLWAWDYAENRSLMLAGEPEGLPAGLPPPEPSVTKPASLRE